MDRLSVLNRELFFKVKRLQSIVDKYESDKTESDKAV